MKKYGILKLLLFLIFLLNILFWGCSSTNPINDFFGIQMDLTEEYNFKIVDYNEVKGVTFQSSPRMEPNVSAWAEIGTEDVKIKIVNKSMHPVPLNYNLDQFVVITSQGEFILEKGNRLEYFSQLSIEPNTEYEITLKLPNDYNTDRTTHKSVYNMLRHFSKFGNTENVNEENIKYIVIKLGERQLLLKKIPE